MNQIDNIEYVIILDNNISSMFFNKISIIFFHQVLIDQIIPHYPLKRLILQPLFVARSTAR